MAEDSTETNYLEELKSIDVKYKNIRTLFTVSFLPPKYIAVGGEDYHSNATTGLILDMSNSKILHPLEEASDQRSHIVVLPNGGCFVCCSRESRAIICNPATGECINKLKFKESIGNPNLIKCFPSGHVLMADTSHNKIVIVSAENGEVTGIYKKDSSVRAINIDKVNFRFVTGHSDGTIFLWNIQTGMSRRCLGKQSSEVTQVFFVPRKNWVVGCCGRDMSVFVYDANTRQKLGEIKDNSADKTAFCSGVMLNDTYLVTGHANGNICVWDIEELELTHQYKRVHYGKVVDMEYHPTSGQLFSVATKTVKVWEVHQLLRTGGDPTLIAQPQSPQQQVTAVVTTQVSQCQNCVQLQGLVQNLNAKISALEQENKVYKKKLGIIDDQVTPKQQPTPQQQPQTFQQGRVVPPQTQPKFPQQQGVQPQPQQQFGRGMPQQQFQQQGGQFRQQPQQQFGRGMPNQMMGGSPSSPQQRQFMPQQQQFQQNQMMGGRGQQPQMMGGRGMPMGGQQQMNMNRPMMNQQMGRGGPQMMGGGRGQPMMNQQMGRGGFGGRGYGGQQQMMGGFQQQPQQNMGRGFQQRY